MALKPAGGRYEGVWINELKNAEKFKIIIELVVKKYF